jgi:hypothetical protein
MLKNYNRLILNDNSEIECLEVKGMKQEWLGSLVIGLSKVENLVHELRKHEPQTIRLGLGHLIGSYANFLEVWLFMAQHPCRNPRNPRIAADKYQTIWLR